MPKRIWYICKYFPAPTDTTIGGRSFLLLKEMARSGADVMAIVSDSNNLVSVPTIRTSVEVRQIDAIKIVWLRTLKYKTAKSMRRIISWLHFEWRLLLLKKSQFATPDVVIVSSLSLLSILNGMLLKRKYKCVLVFEVRDIWPLTLVAEGGFSARNPLVKFLATIEKLGYKNSDAIVGTMPNLGEHVKNVMGYEKPVYCIPMGIDPESFDDDSETLPEGYIGRHIPTGKFIVAYVGTIGITNALDVFFECAAALVGNTDIHFMVVGGGALREHYIDKFGDLTNLTIAPRVNRNQVQAVLSYCDLLYFSVYQSEIWRYGQSLNKVIDYMRSGKPIVASYSGFPSMINEAGCGSFVPAGDVEALRVEIERYAGMPQSQRELMGKKGKEWLIANRQYTHLAASYLDILSKTVSKK